MHNKTFFLNNHTDAENTQAVERTKVNPKSQSSALLSSSYLCLR